MSAAAPRRMLVVASSPLFGHSIERLGRGMGLAVTRVRTPEEAAAHWDDASICFSQGAPPAGLATQGRLPVIVFATDPAAREPALALGAAGFLTVPCSEPAFRDLAERWLAMGKGRGTEVLPPAPSAPPAPLSVAPVPAVAGAEALILIVDDSQVIHGFVDGVLLPNGFRTAHAHDGREGLELATRLRPALVISDIDMPHLDGFEMCRQLKTNPATAAIPIIILSARGAGMDIDRGFDVGANDFLTKPVSENELLSRVEHVLGRGGQQAGGRETVLVVEDSAVQQKVVVQALAQQGFTVLAAENGKKGLDLALHHEPDLVITDAEMPVMNGRDLTRELRRNDRLRDIPVIMLTAADSELSRAKGRHAGVAAYLTKPFVPDKVVVIAEKLIGERRLLRERQAMQHYLSDSAQEAAARAAGGRGAVDTAMRAETRAATILFCDIVGFTPLTERMPPADLVALLNGYFDVMTPLFRRHGGAIDKFIGDAIMAVYVGEGPDAAVTSACGAVRTGLAILEALGPFNARCPEPLQVRIGINSGDVILGDIGSRQHRRDYTVIGDHVNVAARLESAARPGTILISEATDQLVRGEFETVGMAPVLLKGKSQPLAVYEVLGPRVGSPLR